MGRWNFFFRYVGEKLVNAAVMDMRNLNDRGATFRLVRDDGAILVENQSGRRQRIESRNIVEASPFCHH